MLDLLLFSLRITLPIATLVVLGAYFRKIGWLTDAFNQGASKLVFNVALPALLFVNIVTAESASETGWGVVGFGLVFTMGAFILLSLLSRIIIVDPTDRGVFVQGAFRGNMGVVGLAYCLNTYGDSAAALASIFLAALSLLYNILSVITLNRWQPQADNDGAMWRRMVWGLMTNPLIVAITIAAVWRVSTVPVPGFVIDSGGYLAQMTLPLALLSIGASLSWQGFRTAGRITAWTTALKLGVLPAGAAVLGYLWGYQGQALGVLYLMVASPTAAASYMMVRAMGGNSSLAASIIAVTTVVSLFSTSLGLIALKGLGWV